jgi:Reverse transcriptase (RNA-dependent DNA polymerase)
MGVVGAPDVFQEKANALMDGLESVRCYLDDLLIITKGNYQDHLAQVEIVMTRLLEAGLRVNVAKSYFAQQELEYLGYWLTPKGIRPLPNKVEAIQRLERTKTLHQL